MISCLLKLKTHSSYLWCQFQHQFLQKAGLTVLEDGDLGQSREVDADGDLGPQVKRQLLQDLVLSHDLLVDVEMLVPVVYSLPQLFTDVMAAQVSLHLETRRHKKCFRNCLE